MHVKFRFQFTTLRILIADHSSTSTDFTSVTIQVCKLTLIGTGRFWTKEIGGCSWEVRILYSIHEMTDLPHQLYVKILPSVPGVLLSHLQ